MPQGFIMRELQALWGKHGSIILNSADKTTIGLEKGGTHLDSGFGRKFHEIGCQRFCGESASRALDVGIFKMNFGAMKKSVGIKYPVIITQDSQYSSIVK